MSLILLLLPSHAKSFSASAVLVRPLGTGQSFQLTG